MPPGSRSRSSGWPENFLGVAAELNELAQLVSSYLLNVEGVRIAPTLNNDDVLRIEPPLVAMAPRAVVSHVELLPDLVGRRALGRDCQVIVDLREAAHAAGEQAEPHERDRQDRNTPHPDQPS